MYVIGVLLEVEVSFANSSQSSSVSDDGKTLLRFPVVEFCLREDFSSAWPQLLTCSRCVCC